MKSPNPGLEKNLQFFFCLLLTMIHEHLLKAVMNLFQGSDNPRAAESIYSDSNMNILELEIKLESVQE